MTYLDSKSDGVRAYDPFQCVCRFMCVECTGTRMWRSENLRFHSLSTVHGLLVFFFLKIFFEITSLTG